VQYQYSTREYGIKPYKEGLRKARELAVGAQTFHEPWQGLRSDLAHTASGVAWAVHGYAPAPLIPCSGKMLSWMRAMTASVA